MNSITKIEILNILKKYFKNKKNEINEESVKDTTNKEFLNFLSTLYFNMNIDIKIFQNKEEFILKTLNSEDIFIDSSLLEFFDFDNYFNRYFSKKTDIYLLSNNNVLIIE